MLFLTIETTCDETAAAVIDDQLRVLGSVVASQDALHEQFQGVVPEVASRAHVERIIPIIDQALSRAGVQSHELGCIAVANRPGLAGSLLVGVACAKSLSVALGVPLVAINHVHAHLYACRMEFGPEVFPSVGLVASGGHTSLFHCRDAVDMEFLGGTIDDAAGEAFDKIASLLGLPYPGGPAIQRAAAKGNARAYKFPRSFFHESDRLEFSFSGLKTAVRYAIAAPGTVIDPRSIAPQQLNDLAASFQTAVVEVLVAKCRHALIMTGEKALCVGGGVAANALLREQLEQAARRDGTRLFIAPLGLCTDNAIMGALAIERYQRGLFETLDLDVVPGLMRKRRS